MSLFEGREDGWGQCETMSFVCVVIISMYMMLDLTKFSQELPGQVALTGG